MTFRNVSSENEGYIYDLFQDKYSHDSWMLEPSCSKQKSIEGSTTQRKENFGTGVADVRRLIGY
jgi:hypothetical protein